MPAAIDPIRIDGLRDLQAALKAIDGNAQKQLRVVLNSAAELVVNKARPNVPKKTGRAAASLRVSSSQREARVSFGSAKVPYAGWLDYGGKVGIHHSVKRPFVKTGRIVYPSYNEQRPEILEQLSKALNDLVVSSGLEVE